jgi:copper transport protein
MSRRLFAAAVLGLLGILLLPASPAGAHAALVRTSPLQNLTVQNPPYEIVITFSERVLPVKDKIRVTGPDGKRVDKSEPQITGNDLHIPVRVDVPRGTYLVSYRVISADSHPVAGGYTYSVGAPSKLVAAASNDTSSNNRTDGAVATGVSVSRYLSFAGLILVAGPVLVLTALWPGRLSRRAPARLAYLGVGLVALSAVLDLYLQGPYQSGGNLWSVSAAGLGDVLSSTYGKAQLVRLAAAAVAAGLLPLFLAGRGGKPVQVVLALTAVAGVATWPVSGHPSDSNAPLLTIVSDAAHVTSMAIWLGGLVMLVAFVLRRANEQELDAILPVWSSWAALAVTVLVLAGTAQALIEVVTVTALLHTTYGVLLLLKVGLLAVVLAVAAVSRRAVQRRAAGNQSGVRGLRRSVLLEIAGAVVILGLASVLVQTTPARTASAATSGGADPDKYEVTLTSPLYQLQLDIEPVKVGNNWLHLYAFTPQGVTLAVKEWKASAALPAQGIEPVDVPVIALTESHASGSVTLPTAGTWKFSFTLRISEFDEATVSTEVPIR